MLHLLGPATFWEREVRGLKVQRRLFTVRVTFKENVKAVLEAHLRGTGSNAPPSSLHRFAPQFLPAQGRPGRMMSITAMQTYSDASFEELRFSQWQRDVSAT